MITIWLSMASFALVGAITPGPVNLLALRHGVASRAIVPAAFVLGASLSYALIVWLMGTVASNLVAYPRLVGAMRWVAAAYLWYLAWRIACAPVSPYDTVGLPQRPNVAKVLLEGGLSQSLNPKAWLVALSGVGLNVIPQTDFRSGLQAFCAVSFVACLMGVGTWAAAGQVLARWLAAPAWQVRVNRLLGGILALTTISLVL